MKKAFVDYCGRKYTQYGNCSVDSSCFWSGKFSRCTIAAWIDWTPDYWLTFYDTAARLGSKYGKIMQSANGPCSKITESEANCIAANMWSLLGIPPGKYPPPPSPQPPSPQPPTNGTVTKDSLVGVISNGSLPAPFPGSNSTGATEPSWFDRNRSAIIPAVAVVLLGAAVVCTIMAVRARRTRRDAAAALPGPAGWHPVAQDSAAGAAGVAITKPPPPPHGYRHAGGELLASSSKPRQATAPSAADVPGMPGGAGGLPRPPLLQPLVVLGVPGEPAAQGNPAPAVARLPHEAMAPAAGTSSGPVSRI